MLPCHAWGPAVRCCRGRSPPDHLALPAHRWPSLPALQLPTDDATSGGATWACSHAADCPRPPTDASVQRACAGPQPLLGCDAVRLGGAGYSRAAHPLGAAGVASVSGPASIDSCVAVLQT